MTCWPGGIGLFTVVDDGSAVLFSLLAVATGLLAGMCALALRQRRFARELSARDRLLLAMLDNALDLMSIIDASGRYVMVSPSVRCILGRNPEELVGRPLVELVHDDDAEQVQAALAEVMAKPGRTMTIVYGLRSLDGGWRHVEASLRAFRAGPGEPLRVLENSRDITGHLQQQGELRRLNETLEIRVSERTREISERNDELLAEIVARADAEKRLRTLTAAVDQSPSLVLIAGLDQRIGYVNARFRAATGYNDAGLIGKDPYSLLSLPQECDATSIWRQAAGGSEWQGEISTRRSDGGSIPSLCTVSVLRDDAGTGTGFLISIIDISNRKRAEEDRARLWLVIEQVPEAVVITDAEARIQYANPAFEHVTGWSRSEAIGLTPKVLRSGKHDDAFYRRMWSTLRSGLVWSGRLINRRRDGTLFHEEGTIAPVRDESGAITNFVAVKRDITALLSLEEQLRQAQKLEAVGQLAAGIAHEINTPVQFIGDNTRFLSGSFDNVHTLITALTTLVDGQPDETLRRQAADLCRTADLAYLKDEIPKALAQSLDGVERVGAIVRAMKEFAHPGNKELKPADLNHMILNAVTITRNSWRYVAELVTDLDDTLPAVPLAIGDMNQVLLNLIINATHAIEDAHRSDKGQIRISTSQDGPSAVLEIQDNGCGMSDEVRARLFEPFFTTKAVGRGSGQGLPLVRAVVIDQHHGSINCSSEPGKGTTFTIRLPVSCSTEAA
jgi:two-component system, NtrC family, sensor kinase